MALSQDRRGPGERKLTPLPRYFLKEGADALRDQRSHSLSGRWGGGGEKAALRASPTLQRLAPGTLPAGEGQRERRGEDRQGDLRVEGLPPLRRTAPLADSSAGTASFSPAPVQPEHQGAGTRRHPSLRVYLVPFIREGGGV